MKATALVVQGLLLVGLAAGCAMTPATTTTATPSPDGTAMTGPSGSRVEGSTRQAAAGAVRAAGAEEWRARAPTMTPPPKRRGRVSKASRRQPETRVGLMDRQSRQRRPE